MSKDTTPGARTGTREGAKENVRVADAAPGNWVDAYAPAAFKPYLRLMRADRPIGFWLLLWPCWWSTALAAGKGADDFPNVRLLLLFAIGAVVMRGAGCVYNDILDREIDAQVARTRSRPIPSGEVGVRRAAVFLALLLAAGLAVLLAAGAAGRPDYNWFAVGLGAASLIPVAVYPLMKRITNWPQAVLGLAFSWGALMGWAAVLGRLDWPPVVLYIGSVAWTIGYDTIYALQDKEDDAVIGVKSTALRFGEHARLWIGSFYAIAGGAITLAGVEIGTGWPFLVMMAMAATHLFRQVATLEPDDAANCLDRFRSNAGFGAIVFAAFTIDMAWRTF
jgi:4-hydroxybenzoate polyprenyltransferase